MAAELVRQQEVADRDAEAWWTIFQWMYEHVEEFPVRQAVAILHRLRESAPDETARAVAIALSAGYIQRRAGA